MAYHISDDCISCGACEAECPVGAISEGDGKFEINADLCTESGSCAAACPVGPPQQSSIFPSETPAHFMLCRLFTMPTKNPPYDVSHTEDRLLYLAFTQPIFGLRTVS